MTVRSSTVRRGASVLLALGVLAAGALSGCSGRPGAAAVVGGDQISVAYLQTTTADLAPYLKGATQASVLMALLQAPSFDRAATEQGVGVTHKQAVDRLDQVASQAAAAGSAPARTGRFSPGAVEVVRFALARQNLQGLPQAAEVTAQVAKKLGALEVEVNPRYGTVDLATGTTKPPSYAWLVPAAAG